MLIFSWTGIEARLLPAQYPASVSSTQDQKIQIDFPINKWDVDSSYSDNSLNLHNLHLLLDEVAADPQLSLDALSVTGLASPDGSLPKNRELSVRRAVSLYHYLSDKCGVPDSLMHFGESAVQWDLMRELVSKTDYSWRDAAIEILSAGYDNDALDNTRRMNRLKRLAGGEAWRVVKKDILPQLRSAYVITTVVTVIPSDPPAESVDSPAHTDTVCEVSVDSLASIPPCAEIIASRRVREYDRLAIKTNAAFLAAGVTNIGVEFAVAPHWTVDIPLVYSPYTLARNYRLRFLYVQPEARYWLDRPLQGHFLGVHTHAGVANISLNHKSRYQTPSGFYGGGISYGYSLAFAKRWSVEFTVGAGCIYTRYDSYYNIGVPIGARYKKGTLLRYWGIDRIGIDIVYRFGDKSGKRKEAVAR